MPLRDHFRSPLDDEASWETSYEETCRVLRLA